MKRILICCSLAALVVMLAGCSSEPAGGPETENLAGPAGVEEPSDPASPPGSVWEEGAGWVVHLTVTAKGAKAAPQTAGRKSSETYSAKYSASFPLNLGTPAVLGFKGPAWQHMVTQGVEGLGSPEALAVPITFVGESEYQSVDTWQATCPTDDAGTRTVVTKGSADAKGSIQGLSLSPEVQAIGVLDIAADLKSYSLSLAAGGSGTEQTNTTTTTTSCGNGSKNTESNNATRERGMGIKLDGLSGLPLPSTRSALTGSRTIPLRFEIGRFDGTLDANVEWNITPLGR